MSATIRVGNELATINGYTWSGDNARLVGCLNAMLSPLGPSGSDPDPDRTAALDACARIGGELVRATERPSSDPPAGVLY